MNKKEVSELLDGYLYDNSIHTPIETGDRGMYQEYNFTLFRKPNYKFAFAVQGEGDKVTIELYSERRGKREKVFDSREKEPENGEYHIPVESPVKRYVVRYTIPPETHDGCINMALGYKYKKESFNKDKKGRVRIVD